MCLFLLSIFVIVRLTINLEETIKLDDFALGNKLLVGTADRDVDRSLLNLCISHLTGNGTLPDQVVELTLLCGALNLCAIHVGRTNGFVSLLSTLRIGVILTYLAVFLAIELGNLLLAGIDTQTREVDRVSTHIGNLSVLIQVLSHHHGLTNGEA